MNGHPYMRFLSELNRPGQYLGGEFNAAKNTKDAHLRLLLAFPDSYEIGMCHMGLSILYEIVNAQSDISAERVFMPWEDLETKLLKHGIPLVSLETATPIGIFDIIGFSLQYELNYTNLLAMLKLGGIPLRSAHRQEGDPIVLVGGPISMHCEPIVPFVDLCLIGDGEEALPELLELARQGKRDGLNRHALIEKLAVLPAVFAPNHLERSTDPLSEKEVVAAHEGKVARRSIVKDLGKHPTGAGPVPTVKAIFDRYSVEVARGCTAGCRFCQAGFVYRPVRERSKEEITRAVDRATNCLGYDDISLAALSTADHSNISEVVSSLGEKCTHKRVSLAVPSLRAYGLPEDLVEVLSRLRATGVTLAPEAGSQRMRNTINKNVTEDDLFGAAARFFDQGFTRIKLYFMLGLPHETDEDLAEIIILAEKIRHLGRKRLGGRTPVITVSVSTFVPKPFTPFEREEMIGEGEIRRKQAILVQLGKRKKLSVRVHDPRLSQLEGILCRGDLSLAPFLEQAMSLGARFDGWDDLYKEEVWNAVLGDIPVERFLASIPEEARLPWDHVDVGIKPSFLKKERDKAKIEETTEPCGRFVHESDPKEVFTCNACGMKCTTSNLPLRRPRPEAEATIGPPLNRQGGLRPKKLPDQNPKEFVKIRLFMAKWGRQAFVGHLDTMGHVMRSLRRAKLEIVYSQGFHPKPKIATAPPLPLGLSGQREPIDLVLVSPPEDEEILRRLNGVTPEDMAFVGIQRIPQGGKTLSKAIEYANYTAQVALTRAEAQAKLKALLDLKSIEITRTRKGKTKTLDIRPYIESASILDNPIVDDSIPEFENSKSQVAISFSLAMPPSGGARAREILTSAFGEVAVNAPLVRTGFVLGS
jgi:radical SAM family uncharacterized protein/radical SAM-linked protein